MPPRFHIGSKVVHVNDRENPKTVGIVKKVEERPIESLDGVQTDYTYTVDFGGRRVVPVPEDALGPASKSRISGANETFSRPAPAAGCVVDRTAG